MSYRVKIIQRDASQFVSPTSNEIGAMVLNSNKGADVPVRIDGGPSDVVKYFGEPDSTHSGIQEAIEFSQYAPIWLVSAIGTGALQAGIDVRLSTVTGFGTNTGRDSDTFSYSSTSVEVSPETVIASADGLTKNFTGTLTYTTITDGSLTFYVAGTALTSAEAADSGGAISGTSIDVGGTNTINYTTGAYDFDFDGTVGTAADFTGAVDLAASPIDCTSLPGGKALAFNLTIDGTLYENINTGTTDASYNNADLVSSINTAVGSTVAAVDAGSGNVTITGTIGSTTYGEIVIEDPTDTVTYNSGVVELFDALFVEGGGNSLTDSAPGSGTGNASTNPTGSVPTYGQSVTIGYIFTDDLRDNVSHSFFAASPYNDTYEQLAGNITYSSTTETYTFILYQKNSDGTYSEIDTYEYSLSKVKDNFGKSLYIEDVFENNAYVIPFLNTTGLFVGTADPSSGTVDFTGGNRGGTPSVSNYTTSWNNFQKKNKYPAKIFMDVYGNSFTTIQTLLTTYQEFSFGITCVPMGNTVANAITYRGTLGNETKISLYTNWARVEDIYNNSSFWISQVGKIGAKYAQMEDVYDGLAPAGIDESGHGGQLTGARVLEMEYDYSDTDLQNLNEAQINPVIDHIKHGVMVWGAKTLATSLSDDSFVKNVRMTNYLLENIKDQVLIQQVFKNNDPFHRSKAKSLTEAIITPLGQLQLIREFRVVCDTTNNTDAILAQRKFIIDVFVKVTPESEFVHLRYTKVGQETAIAELLP